MTSFLKGMLLVAVVLAAGCSGGSSGSTDTSSSCTSGTFAVAGTVRYEDVEYAESGKTTTTSYFKPVRNAVIDLVACNGTLMATTTTDDTGAYQFAAVTTRPATIRVLAKTTMPSGPEITIKGTGGGRWSTTLSLTDQDLAQPVAIDIARDATAISGVFNMLDVFASGLEYVYSHHTPAEPLPPLNIYWPNSYGTYTCGSYGATYCTSGAGIYITGDLNGVYFSGYDQDHYDDDVLWHELAHYVEYALGITESPGGAHSFSDNTMDLRLAWSEGHADYFQTAVKRWLLNNHAERLSIPATLPVSYYVDTILSGGLYFPSIDLANPNASFDYKDTSYYATSEVAVAKVVWEVSSLNSGGGESAVWNSWTGDWWSPAAQYRDHSLELFWDGLLMSNAQLTAGQIYPLFNERRINYSADGVEPDNTIGSRMAVDCTQATLGILPATCVDELHTLYLPNLVPDVDIVPISVTAGLTYTIRTRLLTNGADTKLRLLNSSGQVLLGTGGVALENDDILPLFDCNPLLPVPGNDNIDYCNNGSNFSSQLTYVPASSGIVYVEASNANFALQNAGAYGGYVLTVTAN